MDHKEKFSVGDDTLEEESIHVTLKERVEKANNVVVNEEEYNQEEADKDL